MHILSSSKIAEGKGNGSSGNPENILNLGKITDEQNPALMRTETLPSNLVPRK